jgi:DNA primase
LGGRSLDPNARAKYLNSPQTPLFDKGRTLYNHGPARDACAKGAALVVAEGYMDVIALAEAGFGGAVAPLGTAITEDQLALLWRIHDEPVVALDGDAAGRRAALRLVDLALPRLEAGKGLRFALLPGAQDPDELIHAKGAGRDGGGDRGRAADGAAAVGAGDRGQGLRQPERKATLDKALDQALLAIRDRGIRSHYEKELKDLRWQLWGRSGGGAAGFRRSSPPSPAKSSGLGTGALEPEDELRRNVLAILVVTPALVPAFAHEIEAMDCPDGAQAALRDALVRHAGAPDLRAALDADLGAEALDRLLGGAHLLSVRRTGDEDLARLDVAEALAKLQARRSHAAALREAEEDIGEDPDEWLTRRLGQAAAQVDVTRRKDSDDTREVVVFDNGLAVGKDEMDRSAEVFARIDPTRGGRGGHRRGH